MVAEEFAGGRVDDADVEAVEEHGRGVVGVGPIGETPVGEVGLPALVGEVSFEPDGGGPRPFLRFGGDEPCSEEPSADRGRGENLGT